MTNLAIFNSFDRANYLEMAKCKVDLVTFSSTLVNKKLLIYYHYSTFQSSSIQIWMQIATKEELVILMIVLEKYCESRLNFKIK